MSSNDDLQYWNQIAGEYSQRTGPDDFVNRHFHAVIWECLGTVRDRDVLDVGCGHGWLSNEIAMAGGRVVGVDGAEDMVAIARRTYPSGTFLTADLAAGLPPLDRQFDRAGANMVLMDLPDVGPLLRDLRQVMKLGGTFVFTMPHPCFFQVPARQDPETGEWSKRLTGYLSPQVWQLAPEGGHTHYHRSLTYYFDHLRAAGFAVTRFYEPVRLSRPEHGSIPRTLLEEIPAFLLIAAIAVDPPV